MKKQEDVKSIKAGEILMHFLLLGRRVESRSDAYESASGDAIGCSTLKKSGKSWKWAVLAAVATAAAAVTPARSPDAASYWVATNGSDSNPGTPAAPFRTIQRAVNNRAAAGDTVYVSGGSYNETFVIRKSGTASARIRVVCQKPRTCRIQPTGNGPTSKSGVDWRQWAILFLDGSYIDIDGFDISPASGGYRQMGVVLLGRSNRLLNSRVQNINTSGAGGVGSCVESEGADNVVERSSILNCGHTTLDHGVYVAAGTATITNNTIGNISGFGVHLWHYPTKVTVLNNTLFNCREGAMTIGADKAVTSNSVIANNVAYGQPIREYGNVSKNRFLNNVVTNPLKLRSGTQSGTIVGNPQFVDYQASGAGDYRLRSNSPAINKALAEFAPARDSEGMARVGAPDVGAFEYQP